MKQGRRLAGLIAAALLVAGAGPAAARSLARSPFWRDSAGWWLADNSYFAPNLDYNIRSYASLIHIEVAADRVIETEIKFYPAGKLALQAGAGLAREGEGVEMVTITTFAQAGTRGSVRQVAVEPVTFTSGVETTITVFNDHTAEKGTRFASEPADHYRLLVTVPTSDRRYIVNYGLVSAPREGEVGALRGFSTSFMRRIDASAFAEQRAALRARFNVQVIVGSGPDHKAAAKRLDQPLEAKPRG